MPFWIGLPLCLLASVAVSYSMAGVLSLPSVMHLFERYLLGPLSALLIVIGLQVILSDPNLQTLSRLASFLHSDAGY